jgi:halogenation protein CepH
MNQHGAYDLIVVGGGPGGSTLATLVAMNNHRVLLLERDKFPRYQIGESLLPATVHGICAILGVTEQIKQANFVRKHGGTFLWGKNTQPWTFSFSMSPMLGDSTGYAYQVERSKFDAILLENARHKGVEVKEEHTVTDVISSNGRITGVQYVDKEGKSAIADGSFVADASGHQTPLARVIGDRSYSKFFQNVALHCYFENGKRLPPPNHGNILCASFGNGWFWYIPLSETLTSVGAVIGRERIESLKNGHEQAMAEFIQNCPIIKEHLSSAKRVTEGPYGQFRVRKDYSYTHSRFWAPGMVLVGDAACFIDPIFSSGVHLATYSALLAARSINTALEGRIEEGRCFTEFERRYRREYSNFYQFLLSFYDTNCDEDSYFWEARKVLNTQEKGNEAFIRLVAGISASDEPVYKSPVDFLTASRAFNELFRGEDNSYLDSAGSGSIERCESEKQTLVHSLLSEIAEIQAVAGGKSYNTRQRPLFAGGLVPTADGLRWRFQNT